MFSTLLSISTTQESPTGSLAAQQVGGCAAPVGPGFSPGRGLRSHNRTAWPDASEGFGRRGGGAAEPWPAPCPPTPAASPPALQVDGLLCASPL